MATVNQNANIASTYGTSTQAVLGMVLNWDLDRESNPYEPIREAFESFGLDPELVPEPLSPRAAFTTVLGYYAKRAQHLRYSFTTPDGAEVERRMFNTRVESFNALRSTKLTSYAFALKTAEGDEVNAFNQVGAITFDHSAETWHWTLTPAARPLPRVKGETDEDYIQRAMQRQGHSIVMAEDYMHFLSIGVLVNGLMHKYTTELEGTSHLRKMLRSMLDDTGCYPLSQRGGFWFVPNVEGASGNPYVIIDKVVRALEKANPEHVFSLLTMPNDERTKNTAANAVKATLLDKVQQVVDEVTKATQSRKGQHEQRAEKLVALASEAQLYQHILGAEAKRIAKAIADANTAITDAANAYGVAAEAKRAEAAASKAKAKAQQAARAADAVAAATAAAPAAEEAAAEPPADVRPRFDRMTASLAGKLLKAAKSEGSVSAVVTLDSGDVSVSIAHDPALGFTPKRGRASLGSFKTAKAAKEAITAAFAPAPDALKALLA